MSTRKSLERFADKDYRDGYLRAQIGGAIAYQVQALRQKLGLSQAEFAKLCGKRQSQISKLENRTDGLVNVQTLLDIATGADVAVLVQFVSYPEFLERTSDMSVAALQPPTIQESLAKAPPQLGPSATLLMRTAFPQQARAGGASVGHWHQAPSETQTASGGAGVLVELAHG